MSWRNTYFEMEQPKLYSLNDGQFAAQYRNGYHTTVEHIFDSAALQIRRTDTPHQYELRECNESFEFSCSESMEADDIKLFMLLLYDCVYEHSYQASRSKASEADIKRLFPIQSTPKTTSSFLQPAESQQPVLHNKYDHLITAFSVSGNTPALVEFDYVPYKGSKLSKNHSITEYISSLQAELYEYIPAKESCIDYFWQSTCTIFIPDRRTSNQPKLQQGTTAKVFTWNYVESGRIYSFMLKISTEEIYDDFSASFAQCLFENSTRIPFRKSRRSDQHYVINAFGNSALDDFDPYEYTLEDKMTSADVDEPAEEDMLFSPTTLEEKEFFQTFSSSKSPILLSAPVTSRLFVIEGTNIAIYQESQDQMQFVKAILGIKTMDNQDLHISQAILYKQEEYLLFLDTHHPHNANKIHKFDIMQQNMVDEWQIEDESPLLYITPSFKSAPQSNEHTFCGITSSAVFRIDPLQAGKNKIKSSEYKKHITKTDFSVAASTASGHLVVAGHRGDMRLFSALNTMARTTMPSIGEPILALDTAASGQYIIATCADFLMLIDAEEQHADQKPIPIILRLRSEHVMLMKNRPKFTGAYFDSENRIIAATGHYLIMWNLQDIYHGRIDAYKIKRLDNVALASCQISTNNSIIVATANGITKMPLSKFKASSSQYLMMEQSAKESEYLADI
ncbi:VID27 cytoplasmic protein-domain-containing protein [Mucor lusitanicus]|uniref:VID27 cytoplasmic protein-domain-containing protein n=1 Tax=Mucor circinelloides f. lusitanicus TaxID=29924 RepID=A0A8H4BJ28_MUCCL|nr:VID27 cytoplasmic protein-domain-containing protein [Mucor lusitanicus]KAF1802468.1 VID27 cytoplasmic protein-domain-containing protein [Mucor lusitanicus]